ncbi:DsbA family protein [Corynebacterium sp. HS2168-gen11]|uniref:DsbA family protein n=1 Tax=Corynebacterium sp. HS2168-gen11 TaxID=2974027 RepID=UPI00216AB2D9|nr:DsbA family protein [Corynebacterium sp. HS2168-gen11]MCS4535598.1 DsbA family protein [Corynebacterium sp. HS2168-gen11]
MSQSQFRSISPTIWAFFATCLIVAATGGYIVGTLQTAPPKSHASADMHAPSAATSEAAATSAPTNPPAAAGTGERAPVTDPKLLDATIFGGSGEVTSEETVTNIHRRNPKDPFAIGAIDAPVVISEFSDFECPFCARHNNETTPKILQEYVDKGLVRIEWNDLPINGEHAVAAAKAARAAAAQGKFHEFATALYARSATISGHPNNTLEDFLEIATEVKVPDLEKFRAQASDDTYDEVIENAKQYATKLGLTGTPGFIVGTTFVSGAQPYEVFQQAIEQELRKAN